MELGKAQHRRRWKTLKPVSDFFEKNPNNFNLSYRFSSVPLVAGDEFGFVRANAVGESDE